MRASILVFAFAAAASPCMAEPYCAVGRAASVGADGIGNNLKSLRERCQPGETVILESNSMGMIASACDFSKAVVIVGQNIICVLGASSGAREQSGAPASAK